MTLNLPLPACAGLMFFLFIPAVGLAADLNAPLRPWAKNNWYWSYHGEPVLLLGGSDDDSLFQWPADRLTNQLDRLVAAGGNVVRNTMSDRGGQTINDRSPREVEVFAFKRLENGQYDLEQWNPDYWYRFERFLAETAKRRIFVQIELWDRFDFTDYRVHHWEPHPWNPANNVNYTSEESGLAPLVPFHPGKNRQRFFYTTPEQDNNEVVLAFQRCFIDRVLKASLEYDHVMYCIDNETNGDPAWSRYWAEFLRKQAAEKGRVVPITEMWDSHDLRSKEHRQTFDHPDLYTFVDVSQNNHKSGQTHWDNFLYVRDYLSETPRPINTTKTYGADGNKFGHSDRDGVERFWRHMLAGAASMRFHRPPSGLGLGDTAVASIKAARLLESRVPLWEAEPANDLLSDRTTNEAYLAAAKRTGYALFLPDGGKVGVDLTSEAGEWRLEWINIETGQWGSNEPVQGGVVLFIESPGGGPWAAAIVPAQSTD